MPLPINETYTGFYNLKNDALFISNVKGKFFIIDKNEIIVTKSAKDLIKCPYHNNGRILSFELIFFTLGLFILGKTNLRHFLNLQISYYPTEIEVEEDEKYRKYFIILTIIALLLIILTAYRFSFNLTTCSKKKTKRKKKKTITGAMSQA